MVLRVSAIVESTIKSIDITAITWKSDGSTGQTKLARRELPGLRVRLSRSSLSLRFLSFILCPSLSDLIGLSPKSMPITVNYPHHVCVGMGA